MQKQSIDHENKGSKPSTKRKSLRLPEYDYAQSGAYFVTVCTHHKACLFGDILGEEMVLNNTGRMVETIWNAIPEYYPGIETDEFVVMPNHVHGIVVITGSTVGATPCGCPNVAQAQKHRQAQGPAPTKKNGLSLPDIMHRFKTMTTKEYIHGVRQYGWKPFRSKLWQRNYFERVIRNEHEQNRIREYIANNPIRWALDRENPDYNPNPGNQT